jgi:hypothetical protein
MGERNTILWICNVVHCEAMFYTANMHVRRCVTIAVLLTSIASVSIVEAAPTVPLPEPGNPIVTVPDPNNGGSTHTSGGGNVTVNVTPPPPDPAATSSMLDYLVSNTEYNHANVPVSMADGLLKGPNIFTNTPWNLINVDQASKLRAVARGIALVLFTLGIVWTGLQLAFGSMTGTTTYQLLLPMMVIGFFLAMFSDTIAVRAVDICNGISADFGDPSLMVFSHDSLTMPPQPQLPSAGGPPGILSVPATFFSSLFTSLIYAIVLIVLEVKAIIRMAVLIVTTTVMPISGVLFAFSITRSWGVLLFRSFFGWLFGQPLVVICLSIAGSILTFFNGVDAGAVVLVKLAVLFVAIKAITLFAPGGLGAGSMFGLAGLMFLFRRAGQLTSGMHGGAAAAASTNTPQQPPRAAVQAGQYSGSGNGTAATSRPWRPVYGAA